MIISNLLTSVSHMEWHVLEFLNPDNTCILYCICICGVCRTTVIC